MTCSALYLLDTGVTVTATPDPGKTFGGWGGDCAAAGQQSSCNLTMSVDRNVTASFSQ